MWAALSCEHCGGNCCILVHSTILSCLIQEPVGVCMCVCVGWRQFVSEEMVELQEVSIKGKISDLEVGNYKS